jgi:hypothetical protein
VRVSVLADAGMGLMAKIAIGVSSATILGGGSMLLSLHRNDAVQDTHIARHERTLEKMEELGGKLDTATTKVEVLNARLEEARRYEPRNN